MLIVVVHSSMLILCLFQVRVLVQNGAGSFGVSIPPAPGSSFCDSKPHDILVNKVDGKVTVTVDSLPSKSASKSGSTSVDAGGNAYIGGIPGEASGLIIIFGSNLSKANIVRMHCHYSLRYHSPVT